MKLTRPNDGASSMPLLALFAPCAPAERRPPTCLSAPQLREDGEALMIIADPASKLHLGAGQLSQFFGLTQAEARLANAIAQGTNLKEHAASTHIAVGTARAQLKSVFGKTGTHRQAELAALLARLAPPIQV